MARALTVLGDGASAADLAAFTGLDPAVVDGAVDALVAAEVVAADEPLRFGHPLVRDALHEDLGPAGRAAEHARAATLLLARGAPAAEVAAHLLLAPPGRVEGAARVLAEAAHEALAAAAPDLAAAHLRRALAEGADPATEQRLGEALVAAGDVAAAVEHLERAARAHEDPTARGRAALALGRARVTAGDPDAAHRTFVAAQDEVGHDDEGDDLWLELEAERLNALRSDTSTPPPESPWMWENLDRLEGRTRGERALLAYASHELLRTGRPAEAVAAARRALAGGRYLADVGSDSYRYHEVPVVFTWSGEVEEARRHFDAALADARRRGSPFGFAVSLLGRAMAGLRSGAALDAEADARSSLAVLEEHGWDAIVPLFSGFACDVLLERDLVDEAAELLRRHGMEGEIPQIDAFTLLLDGRSRLRAAQGRWEEALADARECGARFETWDSRNPVLPWRSTAATALAALGRTEEACEEAARERERADRYGSARAQGIARRTVALLAPGGPELDALREAAALIAQGADRLEEARTRVLLGRALRVAGDVPTARETVLQAADAAHELGAARVLAEAALELRALNARPRRFARTGVDALTASERRTADLAAAGLANREIAQQLFLSVKTVETHLRNAFRKLDVRSRAELADRLR